MISLTILEYGSNSPISKKRSRSPKESGRDNSKDQLKPKYDKVYLILVLISFIDVPFTIRSRLLIYIYIYIYIDIY